MALTAMTDELMALRRRYEQDGLDDNVAAVESTLKRLSSHPRSWGVSAATDREARFQLLPVQ